MCRKCIGTLQRLSKCLSFLLPVLGVTSSKQSIPIPFLCLCLVMKRNFMLNMISFIPGN